MMLDDFLARLKADPESIEFAQTMQVIEDNYEFHPSAFSNDLIHNEKGTNEGSCKIFAFAALNELNTMQTLNCFGKYYREDVLQHPDHDDHGNIRQFMKSGIQAIRFEHEPLIKK